MKRALLVIGGTTLATGIWVLYAEMMLGREFSIAIAALGIFTCISALRRKP